MNSQEFISKLQNIADNHKTTYMWGVFGSPVTEAIITSKSSQYPKWYSKAREAAYRALIGKGYFGFDCVNLIKGILWGWNGDADKANGGAVYNSNGVPDTNADGMISLCKDISSDFNNIIPGEAVWLEGHIGVYIGDGMVIECTPKWSNGVQTTACLNIGAIAGLNGREWKKHGKLPYIEYDVAPASIEDTPDIDRAIRVLITATNTIRVMDLEEYLRGVVAGEMYPWYEPEALKAQAVAARSYALVQMARNKGKDYDVDDTTQYQAYRPEKICDNIDAAVMATRGQVLTHNGQVAKTVYSYSNGGRTVSAAAIWGGNAPYLTEKEDSFNKDAKHGHGVGMSQCGAQARALAGYSYRDILAFYYPGTVLSRMDAEEVPEPSRQQKTENEITVDNAIADGVLMDRPLWLDILDGNIPAEPERVKTAFDRYHNALLAAKEAFDRCHNALLAAKGE